MYNCIALFEQPGQIIIIVLFQKIHKTEDVLVIKIRLLIVSIQLMPGGMLRKGVKDPCIGQEAGDRVTIKCGGRNP